MCGIALLLQHVQEGIIDPEAFEKDLRGKALVSSRILRHRGPDDTGAWQSSWRMTDSGGEKKLRGICIAHERLSIVDPEHGVQPFVHKLTSIAAPATLISAANGEVYNHKDFRAASPDYPFSCLSDCEAFACIYAKSVLEKGDCASIEDATAKFAKGMSELRGVFSMCTYDVEHKFLFVGRDAIGVVPLYIGYDKSGKVGAVTSEMKSIPHHLRVELFPPGKVLGVDLGSPDLKSVTLPWYTAGWKNGDTGPFPYPEMTVTRSREDVTRGLRDVLVQSVKRRMMCDVPYGVLLSGGLDSSIVGSIVSHFRLHRVEDGSEAWYPRPHSFCIGLKGSPDLAASEQVAKHLGTVHHSVEFTVQEALDVLPDVIWHLETYDITTIRASTPMWLLARRIKSYGIKMVLTGEGADELFGGYLYFHKAPSDEEFHRETVRKVKALHQYDCLRANKSLMAWGVEGRVPFLDVDVIEYTMSIDPSMKRCGRGADGAIEKKILRDAFAKGVSGNEPERSLPHDLLYRQKEQFSDGVGYNWIDSLRAFAEDHVTDEEFARAAEKFPINTPPTKEGYWYRTIFESKFPIDGAIDTVPGGPSVACSTAVAVEWDAAFKASADPSGRAVAGVHDSAYKE
eukprot:m.30138 g.30138  ORF g.30138 m.30138 type:complete len:625 (+) comp8175_c0_seq1:146-2020(+)